MKLRHRLAKGGKVEEDYGKKAVMSEAKERKFGGEVGKVVGRMAGGRLDRKAFKRGGKVEEDYGKKAVMSEGKASKKGPYSSAGGGGADKNPFLVSAKGPRGG